MTCERLTREMSVRELTLWRIKWSEQPWGELRADMRAAQSCMLLANIHRDAKKRAKPFDDITEFMLFKPPAQEAQRDPDERPRGATMAPETVAWFYAIAKQHEVKPPKPIKRKAQ